MQDPMGLQVTFSNGYTFLIDFVDYANADERDAILEKWSAYYKAVLADKIGEVPSFSFCMFDSYKFDAYDYYAETGFGKSFTSLSCKEKLSITEMVDEMEAY